MEEIQWRRGQFLTFFRDDEIRVGAANGGIPVDIGKDHEFEYDGSILKYAGQELPQPSLRAAIREGWAVMEPGQAPAPAPKQAGRDVALSQSKNSDLSRVQRHKRKVMESDSLDEETVISVSDRSAVRDPNTGKGHLKPEHNQRKASTAGTFRGLEVTGSDVDEQDYTPLGRVKSAAKLKMDVTANPNAARDIELRDRESGYGAFHGKRRADSDQVIEREGVIIKTSVGSVDKNVRVADEDEGTPVGRVRHSSPSKKTTEGVTVEDTGRPRAKAKAAAKPAPAAKPARIVKLPASASPKLKLAVRLCGEFPTDWNFFATAKDKLSRIKELGADPGFLDALHATESPAMKRILEKEFKAHFA